MRECPLRSDTPMHARRHAIVRMRPLITGSRDAGVASTSGRYLPPARQPRIAPLPSELLQYLCRRQRQWGHRSSRQGVQPIGDDTTLLHAAPPRCVPFLSAPRTTPRRHLSTTCCSAHNASPARPLQACGQMRRFCIQHRKPVPRQRPPTTRASGPAVAPAVILRPLVNLPPSARHSAR